MFLKITAKDNTGAPVPNVALIINDRFTGLSDTVYTDGNGYGDTNIATVPGSLLVFAATGHGVTGSDSGDPRGPMYYVPTLEPTEAVNLVVAPFKRPFIAAPRRWTGNMCGIRVDGVELVPGTPTANLVLSWFYDRYIPQSRALIRQAMHARGITDVLLSWPDARANGCSPAQFGAICQELIADGFYPCPMLYSKDYDPSDVAGIQANIEPVLPYLIGVVPRVCVGWELSIALSPAVVQQLIDWLAPLFVAYGCKVYVHFQQGYFAYQVDGGVTADFWVLQVGKLTGVLHQRVQSGPDTWDKPMYQARIVDCLERFAGQYGFQDATDSGFGHPFDFIALEITAEDQYNGDMSEDEGNTWGQTALTTPGVQGPLELVVVQGSGNGQ